MTRNFEPSVGIVGNLGPVATYRLYEKIIERFRAHRAAVRNAEFPRVIVHSPRAIENVRESGDSSADIVVRLSESLQFLNAAEVSVIGIPCNTIHTHLPTLRRESVAPIVDMVQATASACATFPEREALILATRGTLADGLYQRELEARGIEAVVPIESIQVAIDDAIDAVCAGQSLPSLEDLVTDQVGRPADRSIILACTELSELLPARRSLAQTFTAVSSVNNRLHDSLSILADAIYYELLSREGKHYSHSEL